MSRVGDQNEQNIIETAYRGWLVYTLRGLTIAALRERDGLAIHIVNVPGSTAKLVRYCLDGAISKPVTAERAQYLIRR